MPLTKTYARILESQGFKSEALDIYQKLLKKNPKDKELLKNIKRIQKRNTYKGVNVLKLKEFENLNNKNRYKFEKWLGDMKWT